MEHDDGHAHVLDENGYDHGRAHDYGHGAHESGRVTCLINLFVIYHSRLAEWDNELRPNSKKQ